MLENNSNNKGTITEKDIATLLQRYTATTVLTLLQEVGRCSGDKIDWSELVRNTSSGITNAREYQMLWRHLAYRSLVSDDIDEGAQPLDDDSDLEYELAADPSVSYEASAEAAACVKVMMASGLSSDSNMPNCSTIEAPLTINIPDGDSSGVPNENTQPACSAQGVNITVPISVQKQPLPASTSSAGPANNITTSASMASRKKRKKWSTEEDMELIAAVQKCGEGNWANILRGDFKGDRTASQLSQRWSTLRRRKGETNTPVTSSAVPQLTEAQLAARHAMSMALGTPAKNLNCGSGGPSLMSTPNIAARHTAVADAPPRGRFAYGQHQSQQAPIISKSSPVCSMGLSEKSQVSMKKVLPMSNMGSDSVIATAVAAGARIVTPSDAGTLLKAAQAKTAMRISPTGCSSKKLPMAGGNTTQAHTPAATLNTNHPAATSSTSHTVKAASPKLQHTPSPSASAVSSKSSTEQNVGAIYGPGKINISKGLEVSKLKEVPKVVEEGLTLSTKDTIDEQVKEKKAAVLAEAELQIQVSNIEIPNNALDAKDAQNDPKAGKDNPAEDHHRNDLKFRDMAVKGGENQTVDCQKQNTYGKQGGLQRVPVDASGEKLGVPNKVERSNGV